MKGFYVLLAAVAVIGGGVIWYGSRGTPAAAPAASALPPLPATDGFRGFTLGADAAPIEVTEYSDFECPYCASFATVQMPVIREPLIATGEALGIGGTPTFFVNGKRFDGHPTSDAFKALVDSLAKQTKPRK